MKIKRHIARGLTIIYLISNLTIPVFANPQNPVTSLYDPIVGHRKLADTLTREETILPSVELKWEQPSNNPVSVDEPARNNKDVPDYYSLYLKDMTKGTTEKSTEVRALTTKLEDVIKNLQNGTYYNVQIVAQHEHSYIDADGRTRYELAPYNSTDHANAYFITDFDTKVKGTDGKLEISWEYIPGIEYQVGYAQGNYSEKSLFPANKVEFTVRESDITTYRDATTGKQRAKIELANGIVPGQIYSAYVYPRTDRTQDDKAIYANRTSPKIAIGVTEIALRVYNIGKEKIRLEWSIEPEILQGQRYKLIKSEIYEQVVGSQNPELITTLHGTSGAQLGYYEYREPREKAEYYIVFTFQNIVDGSLLLPNPQSKKVLYIPYELREKPLQPRVPEPSDGNTFRSGGAVEDYKRHVPTNDDIYNLSHAFYAETQDSPKIYLVWDAPYKTNTEGQESVEYQMLYDIWVADSKDTLNDEELTPTVEDLNFSAGSGEDTILRNSRNEVVGFRTFVNQYYTKNKELENIVTNKTYYIKLIAKRPYGDIFEKSLPTIVSITFDKNGDISVPPVLGKPPLALKEVTNTTATIKWLEKWMEITANNPSEYSEEEKFLAGLWNSKVFTRKSGGTAITPPIRFMGSNELQEHILKTQNDIDNVRNVVAGQEGSGYYETHYADRSVTLGRDTQYEVKVLTYDKVNTALNNYNEGTSNKIGIEEWIVRNESDSTEGWQSITPSEAEENDGLNWKLHTVSNLQPNTRYVLLIRAYRITEDGTKQQQTYPSYVVCTTLSDYTNPEETPKVPELHLEGKTDTSISVWWTYNSSFDYEIIYGRTDRIEDAKPWEFTISDDPRDENYLSDGSKAVVNIKGLFPDTVYNIWIRAKQKQGDKVSAWSNPVTAKTDAIGTPPAPTGLGIAAYQSILELGLDFPAVDKNYITVEWTRVPGDVPVTEGEESTEKEYRYVVEFADNVEFLDSIVVTTTDQNGGSGSGEGQNDSDDNNESAMSAQVLAKNMVRFNGLNANKPYYVRVKTVLIYKDLEGNREIVKESEFTKWIRILTKKSDDEYDGGDNDNIVIYPEAIVETMKDNIWTWEIVDNNKIISDILKKKDYFFSVNVQLYKNKTPCTTRRVRIPKPVIDTLINQRMALKITTDTGIYEVPADAIKYYSNTGSSKDIVQFEFKEMNYADIATVVRDYPEVFSRGEKMTITLKGTTNKQPISKVEGYIRVRIELDGIAEEKYGNMKAYTYANEGSGWTKEYQSLDKGESKSYISYKTPLVGIYALYEKQNIASSVYSNESMKILQEKYIVAGLGTVYKKNSAVHSNQYINLLLGIAQNKPSIDMSAPIYSDTKQRAKAIGIYISSGEGNITQEQALHGVVRLYELKTGYKVKPSSVPFNNVSQAYRESASKAYALGLITDIDPKASINYGMLCDWLVQVSE